jgi:para-nitrobenzyl esterase
VAINNTYFESFASAAGCNASAISQALDCLRSVPVGTIANASAVAGIFGGSPTLGGYIAEQPAKRLREGRYLRVPVLSTTVLDEGTL